MNVLIGSEHHFVEVAGQVYCRTTTPAFFQRYRGIWENVNILARLSQANEPPPQTPPLDFRGIRVIGLPEYRGLWQFFQRRHEIRRIARQAVNEAESIVLRAPGVISTVVWSLVRHSARPYGIEVVGDPQEAFARGAARHPLRPIVSWLAGRQLRAQCHEAYASAYVTAHELQKRFPPNSQRFTIGCSDVDLDAEQILPEPRKVFSNHGVQRIVMIGTFSQMYKGQHVLLTALARLQSRNVKFEMVFVGDGKHKAEMQDLANSLGIGQSTTFLGELPAGEAVRAQLDRAHLFVLPSRTEGLPRAMIEAMARGLPCIGTRVGGIPELIGPEEMVPPNDPDALANKLFEVLNDPERMARLSEQNLNVASGYRKAALESRRNLFYQHVRAGSETWLRENRCPATELPHTAVPKSF